MMLIGTALLAVPCFFAKQSQILCYIVVGVVVGHVKGPSGCTWKQEMHLSDQTAAVLFDLGILFVLFMGGMEVDLGALKAAWKLVLINGMGQIILNLVSFTVICILCANPGGPFDGMQPTVKDKDGVEVPNFGNNPDAPMWGVGIGSFFFGICYTLSSTILVLGALKKRGELGKLHGQIILGLMVLQDVTAVLSIAVMLNAFKAKPIKGPNARRGAAEGEAPKQEPGIGEILGGLIMWLILLPIFLYILNKTVLAPVFKFFAKTRELLFIITFAYSLGVAALFGHFLPYWIWGSFSQEIGIFFAGVSIAALPYRVQIETFVEPIRAFGVVLFFFILGINLPVNSITPMAVFMGVILALLTVFVFPMFLWLTGWLSGVDGKTAFLIGLIVNQVSEFSLIIGEMAYRENIFTNTMFLTIVIGTLITFVFSSMGHLLADSLYDKIFCKCLSCLDFRATVKDEAKESFKLSDHIVLLGFNEIGLEISEFFREHEGMDVLVIHDNPDLHILFESFYNPGQAAIDVNDAEKGGRIEDKVATNIYSQYADPNNPDTWHHYELHAAGMVVSCQQGTTV
jgi:Kef-type K+ transport system membrane component KefB